MDIDTEIASYFINDTVVDQPYVLSESQREILLRKQEIYSQLLKSPQRFILSGLINEDQLWLGVSLFVHLWD